MTTHKCDCGLKLTDREFKASLAHDFPVDWHCPIGDAVQPDAQPACPECEARESFQQMREAVRT